MTMSSPVSHADGDHADAVMAERRRLINLGYRLLGSLVEAEDVVQETYARWYAMTPQEREAIESPGAWLTTVNSRICLNVLGSARARRERYVGNWIPEPLPDGIVGQPESVVDPADRVALEESLSMAFLVVLEAMTPAERVSFILHDVFGYSFAEISEIVGRSPAASRQLASSARRRLRSARAAPSSSVDHARIVRDFKRAWKAKDVNALVGLLDPDATATADGGGLAVTFLQPIHGAEAIARVWAELADRVTSDMTLLERRVNGQPGLITTQHGAAITVFAFEMVGERIKHIWVMRNPEKLRPWTTA